METRQNLCGPVYIFCERSCEIFRHLSTFYLNTVKIPFKKVNYDIILFADVHEYVPHIELTLVNSGCKIIYIYINKPNGRPTVSRGIINLLSNDCRALFEG